MSRYDTLALDHILAEMELPAEDKYLLKLRDASAEYCQEQGRILPREAGAALGHLFAFLLAHTDEIGRKRAERAFKDAMTAGSYATCGMDSIAVH